MAPTQSGRAPIPAPLARAWPSCRARLAGAQVVMLTVSRQPFDEDYLNHLEPPVKHMSFHAYIRKLTGGADK